VICKPPVSAGGVGKQLDAKINETKTKERIGFDAVHFFRLLRLKKISGKVVPHIFTVGVAFSFDFHFVRVMCKYIIPKFHVNDKFFGEYRMRLYSTLLTTFVAVIVATFALTACSETNATRQTAMNNPTTQQTPSQNTGVSITPTPAIAPTDGAPRISIADAQKEVASGNAIIVDVRDEASYKAKHIKDAINLPLDKIVARLNELPKDKKIITYCA